MPTHATPLYIIGAILINCITRAQALPVTTVGKPVYTACGNTTRINAARGFGPSVDYTSSGTPIYMARLLGGTTYYYPGFAARYTADHYDVTVAGKNLSPDTPWLKALEPTYSVPSLWIGFETKSAATAGSPTSWNSVEVSVRPTTTGTATLPPTPLGVEGEILRVLDVRNSVDFGPAHTSARTADVPIQYLSMYDPSTGLGKIEITRNLRMSVIPGVYYPGWDTTASAYWDGSSTKDYCIRSTFDVRSDVEVRLTVPSFVRVATILGLPKTVIAPGNVNVVGGRGVAAELSLLKVGGGGDTDMSVTAAGTKVSAGDTPRALNIPSGLSDLTVEAVATGAKVGTGNDRYLLTIKII